MGGQWKIKIKNSYGKNQLYKDYVKDILENKSENIIIIDSIKDLSFSDNIKKCVGKEKVVVIEDSKELWLWENE